MHTGMSEELIHTKLKDPKSSLQPESMREKRHNNPLRFSIIPAETSASVMKATNKHA